MELARVAAALAGRYAVEGEPGRGGMATVYLAEDLKHGRRVAIKVLRAEVLRRLEELSTRRYVSPNHLAYVHTGLGDNERALDWLERAYEERAGGVFGVKGSFLFAPLRAPARFTPC